MDFQNWIYYLVAILVLTASPGPSVLLCMTTSVTRGFKASIYAALGSLTAIYIILTLSFTGLGLVISQSELVFNVIKWTGAAYLIYLGIRAFLSKDLTYKTTDNENVASGQGLLSNYVSGFMVGASNPKAIVFFTALFPQFIDPGQSLWVQYVILASTFVVLEFSWLMFYAFLGERSSEWIMKEGRAQIFNRITGGVFVTAGLWLSNTNRSSI